MNPLPPHTEDTVIYLTGGISDHEDGNKPQFDLAARLMRQASFQVINAHELLIELPDRPDGMSDEDYERWCWLAYLERDLHEILHQRPHGMAVLHDHLGSAGVMMERVAAERLVMPYHDVTTWLMRAQRSDLAQEWVAAMREPVAAHPAMAGQGGAA